MYNQTIFQWLPKNPDELRLQFEITSFAMFSIVLSVILERFKIPQQFSAICLGAIISGIHFYQNYSEEIVYKIMWEPKYMLLAYHPLLILNIAYNLDIFLFKKSIVQMLLMSFIGMTVFSSIVGVLFNMFCSNSDISFFEVAISGALIANIDVPNLNVEATKIRNLQVILNGECIIGSALTLQVILIVIGHYDGFVNSYLHVFMIYIRYIIIGLLVGLPLGFIAMRIFKFAYNDDCNGLAVVLSFTYLSYVLCQNVFYGNGAIASFIVVLMLNTQRINITNDTDKKIMNSINILYQISELVCCTVYSIMLFQRIWKDFIAINIIIGLGLYIVGNITRLLCLIMFCPLLHRLGYGFDFATLITAFWATKRGSLTLLWLLLIYCENHIEQLGIQTIAMTLMYCMLSSLLNMAFLKIILEKLGLLNQSKARMTSINSCYKYINERTTYTLETLKMKRYFSEINWEVVKAAIALTASLKIDDDRFLGRKEAICSSCHKPVAIQPTVTALNKMLRDAQIRVLKSIRITVMREDDLGYLDKKEMQLLNMAIENALNSETCTINIEKLVTMCQKKRFVRTIRDRLMLVELQDIIKLPDSKWRRRLYILGCNKNFILSYYLFTALWLIYIVIMLIYPKNTLSNSIIPAFLTFELSCLTFFVIDFTIKIFGLTASSFKYACIEYFRDGWNIFDFFMLISLFLYLFDVFKNFYAFNIEEYIQFITALRYIKLYKMVLPSIIRSCDQILDNNLKHCFVIAKTLIMGFDEVLDHLLQMSDNESIRVALIRMIMESKQELSKYMGIVASAKPVIPNKCNSIQAATCIAKNMSNTVNTLRATGHLDDFEYKIFKETTDEMLTYLSTRWIVPMRPNRDRIYNVSYLLHDQVTDFIYSNIIMKVWECGDVVVSAGKPIEGIIFIITGIIKMVYTPTDEILVDLKLSGLLPPKDSMNHVRFDEEQTDYYWVSQTVGELPVLMNQSYCAELVTELATRAFIIPDTLLKTAFEMDSDPINGLESRMWKYITHNLATSIMKSNKLYSRMPIEQLHIILSRAFVPSIIGYKTFVICELIEDIILLSGSVMDFYSSEILVAPCLLPRHVRKLTIDFSTKIANVAVKMLILPSRNVDPYKLMQLEEDICDLENLKRTAEYWLTMRTQNKWKIKNEMMNKPSTPRVRSSSLKYKYSLQRSTAEDKLSFNVVKKQF